MKEEEYTECSRIMACLQNESDLWQHFVQGLAVFFIEKLHNDSAKEIAEEQPVQEDSVKGIAEQPTRTIITRTQDLREALDLDAPFGGRAIALEDEDEEPAIKIGCSGFENANTISSTKPILRSYMPEDLPKDLSDWIDNFYNHLPPELHTESQIKFARFFSMANVEWKYMSRASRQLQGLGTYVPKKLQEANRSCDWFWENGRPSHTVYYPSTPVANNKIPPLFHHRNFLGYPVHHKSSTPAAVSLWLAFTSHKKHVFHRFSRQGVIASQATKLVDPFVYRGPKTALWHSGTELRNAVVGLVEKVYSGQGTWLYDSYDEDDEVPIIAELIGGYVYHNGASTGKLQEPHWMCRNDWEDTIINDGKSSYTPKPTRKNPDEVFERSPSKLRTVVFADYATEEVMPVVSTLQPRKKDNIDIDSDIIVVDGWSKPKSSNEEDTTKYTPTTKAAYQTRFSEDNHRSNAAKPNSTVISPHVAAETDNTDSIAKPLGKYAKDNEQHNVACRPAENHADTASDIERDTESQDEVSAIDCKIDSFPSESDTNPMLAVAVTIAERSSKSFEETAEPTPPSGHFTSTTSPPSTESVAEMLVEETDTAPVLPACNLTTKLVAGAATAWKTVSIRCWQWFSSWFFGGKPT